MKATYRPLIRETWLNPTPRARRRGRATFKAPWESTLQLLDHELRTLKASDCVIEADFAEKHIRLDGLPRTNAPQPDFPGVRIAFTSPKVGDMIYQTDVCQFWQHNVRSIALGLEALRAVDRYGITAHAEQYLGFKALPPGSPGAKQAGEPMTEQQAHDLIMSEAALASPGTSPSSLEQAWKAARRNLHPDQFAKPSDWTRARWDRLMQAGEVLGV